MQALDPLGLLPLLNGREVRGRQALEGAPPGGDAGEGVVEELWDGISLGELIRWERSRLVDKKKMGKRKR